MMQQEVQEVQEVQQGGDVLYFGVFLNGWMDFLVVRLKKTLLPGFGILAGGTLLSTRCVV